MTTVDHSTSVQLRRDPFGSSVWFALDEILDIDDDDLELNPVTIGLSDGEMKFLDFVVAYRNATAEDEKKAVRRKLTRKKLVESFVQIQSEQLRLKFSGMLEALGPFPEKVKDKAGMHAFAKRAVAWSKVRGYESTVTGGLLKGKLKRRGLPTSRKERAP